MGDGGFDFCAGSGYILYGQGSIGRLLDSRTGEVGEGLLRSLRGDMPERGSHTGPGMDGNFLYSVSSP